MESLRLPFAFKVPVRTTQLLLRPMTEADIDDIHAYQSRADVCRYLSFEPRTREQVAEKVAEYSVALTLNGDGDFWQLAIERAGDRGRVIGDVYFCVKSTANASAEIGWTLHPDHAGAGYMTEAAGAVLQIAFEDIGLHRVTATSTRATTNRPHFASVWGCAGRHASSSTCGPKANGLTRRSTRSSTVNGPSAPAEPADAVVYR